MRTEQNDQPLSFTRDVEFIDSTVRFTADNLTTGETFDVTIKSPVAVIRSSLFDAVSAPSQRRLTNWMPVDAETGCYAVPEETQKLRRAVRENALIAVGYRSDEWPILFQLRGRARGAIMLACLLQSEDAIQIEKRP